MGNTSSGATSTLEGMPWKEISPMQQRKQFVEDARSGRETFAHVCRRYGISRKTGYKWVKRTIAEAADALSDRSRRPHRHPHAVDTWIESAIVSARQLRPTWGPKKLRAVLAAANPRVALPSVSTFAAILKRNGLVAPRRRRRRAVPPSTPLAHATAPNAVWCVDFKGQFRLGRSWCYPLTITDAYSRYVIACVALRGTKLGPVRRAFERIFFEYGVPDAIRSDNGVPFTSPAAPRGLSELSAWWHRLGIRHERIEPGRPDQNGSHERMHRTLQQDCVAHPERTFAAQQRRFDRWRVDFNERRPHEALGQRPPALFYARSQRPAPEPLWGRDFAYDILDGWDDQVRVDRLGRVRTHAGSFFVSTALRHQLLGVKWRGAKQGELYFGTLCLGRFSPDTTRPRRVGFVLDAQPVTHVAG
jgi:transposase InsO family protein